MPVESIKPFFYKPVPCMECGWRGYKLYRNPDNALAAEMRHAHYCEAGSLDAGGRYESLTPFGERICKGCARSLLPTAFSLQTGKPGKKGLRRSRCKICYAKEGRIRRVKRVDPEAGQLL